MDKHSGGISKGAEASPQPKQTNKRLRSVFLCHLIMLCLSFLLDASVTTELTPKPTSPTKVQQLQHCCPLLESRVINFHLTVQPLKGIGPQPTNHTYTRISQPQYHFTQDYHNQPLVNIIE